jgi:DNA-binding NarL/FixJ family response regulator
MIDGTIRDQAVARPPAAGQQPETGWIANELDRLELLVPEAAGGGRRDPLVYALAYVEHYRGDVLHLEHEQEFLSAATILAAQRAEYAVATRLVDGLAPIVGRFGDSAEAVRILRLGIDASRRTRDVRHLARFMNRLGDVPIAQGRYRQGSRIWLSGLRLGQPFGLSAGIWEPLSSFAQIVDILGDYAAAGRYAETISRSGRDDDADALAVVLFARGLHARMGHALDTAYEDFSHSLRLLSSAPAPASHDRQLFAMAIQTELARVQGNYARAQAYAESALSLAQLFGDYYIVATLLIDQGQFTRRYGPPEDTRAAYRRLRDVSPRVQARHIHNFSALLERYLAATAGHAMCMPPTPLSERESELLQLVAAGLANRQIAAHLVITPGTVKKHLEHIYAKLDVHSRTAAVAKARSLKLFS